MVVLAVKSGVAQTRVDVDVARGLSDQRTPENAFVRRSSSHPCGENQMRRRIATDRKLGPKALTARFFAYARLIMFAGMAFFKTGRVDGGTRGLFKKSRQRRLPRAVDRTKRGTVL